jgi:hypothetical protein
MWINYSSQRNKSHTKTSTEKDYIELSEMITEWFGLYYAETHIENLSVSRYTMRKYKSLKRFIKKSFSHDPELKKYVKILPKVSISWTLKEEQMAILALVCYYIFGIINDRFFKMYTGILIPDYRGNIDLVYVTAYFTVIGIFVYLWHRRWDAFDKIESTLFEIKDIVNKKLYLIVGEMSHQY